MLAAMEKWKITTPRLTLTPYPVDEVDAFLELNTNEQVRRYLWDDRIISRDEASDILQQNARQFQQENCGLWQVRLHDLELQVGYAGLWYFFDEPQPQLLYILWPSCTGRGFASEAAKAICNYAFSSLQFTYLLAACDTENSASRQLAERLGMELIKERTEAGRSTIWYRMKP